MDLKALMIYVTIFIVLFEYIQGEIFKDMQLSILAQAAKDRQLSLKAQLLIYLITNYRFLCWATKYFKPFFITKKFH